MKLKTIASIITFSIIATTMTQANSQNSIIDAEPTVNSTTADAKTIYQSMTTEELQIAVETHSNKDCLTFALGKELIKRWTKS